MFARTRWLRVAPLALALSLTLPAQACFGKFALTVKLWEFNDGISESYLVKELVFLGLNIVPAYAVVGFIDLFILNLVELITGSNPVAKADGDSRSVELADGSTLTLAPTANGALLTRQIDGEVERWAFRNTAEGLELTDGQGRLIAETVRLDDGTFQVVDADGQVLAHPGRALLAELDDAWLRNGARGVVAAVAADATSRECLAAR